MLNRIEQRYEKLAVHTYSSGNCKRLRQRRRPDLNFNPQLYRPAGYKTCWDRREEFGVSLKLVPYSLSATMDHRPRM